MLVKFSVKNYKQFKEEIVFDLSAGNYSFNEECVKDGVVKTALIYGANGTGKTNIGLAIFDFIENLTSYYSPKILQKNYYANAYSSNDDIEFSYVFHTQGSEIIYNYTKSSDKKILCEQVIIDGNEVIYYETNKRFRTNLKGTESLNKEINSIQNLSVLSYILNNANLDYEDHRSSVFIDLMAISNTMVWLQTLSNDTNHISNTHVGIPVLSKIVTQNYLEDFEDFLNFNGVDCKLTPTFQFGELSIAFDFNGKKIPFSEIASTGTKHLATFYSWWIESQNIPLLFIDEFDSSYHFKLSSNIVKKLKELPNTQVILTTHNTNLLNNDLIRPDCGFIIDGKEIKALQHCTKRELRHAHNLEKMYKAGSFNV